jgi:hypothetical protein
MNAQIAPARPLCFEDGTEMHMFLLCIVLCIDIPQEIYTETSREDLATERY